MSFLATAIIGAGALGAGASIYGSTLQSQAAGNAAALQQSEFNTAQQNEQPFINAGQQALPTLQSLLTPGPNQTSTLNQIPGFQFMQDWGQKGVTAQATTRGLGGNALTAGANYATGTAQQSFGGIVNALQALVNTGAGTGGTLGNQAVQTGANAGGSLISQGNAQASGVLGASNALGGSVSNLAILNALSGGTAFGGGAGGGMYSPNANIFGPQT